MGYTNTWTYTGPTATATVNISATRSGANITVTGTITCSFVYSDDFLAYDGAINWNLYVGSQVEGTEVKGYSDRWYASNEKSRTRSVSITIQDLESSAQISFSNSTVSGYTCFNIPYTTITLTDIPAYLAPSKPTWISINPSTAHVYSPNSSSTPVITWGGASAGTLGTLYYDLEIRMRNTNGNWTDWYRASNAQTGTSYTDVPVLNAHVYGVTMKPGVALQYRVQSSDGSYATSGFIESKVLEVSFTAPTAPTRYTASVNPVKSGGSSVISWSGASGGAGNISKYNVSFRFYDKSAGSWSSWSSEKSQTSTNITIVPKNYFSSIQNGDQIQIRVTVVNSYNVSANSSATVLTIKDNTIYIKINGAWKEATPYIKINGSWKEGTPYIKINGNWKESN